MKILHVNTLGSGGAFNGSYRLQCALLKNGIESNLLVRYPPAEKDLKNVILFRPKLRGSEYLTNILFLSGVMSSTQRKIDRYIKGKKGKFEIISFPFSDTDITKTSLYDQADIIHLHWVGDFLDYKSFFRKNKKPVVWTIRDAYPYQGIFHLINDLDRNQGYWTDLNDKMISYKMKCLSGLKSSLTVVGISNHITSKSKNSDLLRSFEHHQIYNCIDTAEFSIISKTVAREHFALPEDKIIFSFVSDFINRYNKGFDQLAEAINSIVDDNLFFISVGQGSYEDVASSNYKHLGSLNSRDLAMVYSASDAFIFPTQEEALGNVMLEAMACGTPVIGTPVGGLLEVINDGQNGILCESTSAEDIQKGIERFLRVRKKFNHHEIRQYIVDNFSEDRIAKSYIDLYSNILE